MKICDRAPPASGGPRASPGARARASPRASPGARPLRFLAVAAAVGLLLASAVPAMALSVLVSPAADLPAGQNRIHPDATLGLLGSSFNVYLGAAMPAAWVSMKSLTTPFSNQQVAGTFYSEVYRHSTDGHTLFTYKIHNTGSTEIRSGNIAGFASGWEFLDSGILDIGGDVAFNPGDVLKLHRPENGTQLNFAFEAMDSSFATVEKLLAPTETSSWFYAVTDAPSWTIGQATVQNTGSSASPVAVLVPVPEPLTVLGVFMGVVGVGSYVRRRRLA